MARNRGRWLFVVLTVLLVLGAVPAVLAHGGGGGGEDDHSAGPIAPDPAFLEQVDGEPCTPENEYEQYEADRGEYAPALYGDACKRIRFAFGPIHVKPGQNDALIEPVDIEKPAYDGYIVRFKPDLVRALDGGHPRTEDLHLHHATWLNLGESYGDGPFFAAGEEKTIANFPKGYGMEVGATDLWGLLYMVHNATASAESVWITYQIDYVAKADAEALGIRPVKPVWLDVQKHSIHPDAPGTSAYPVFNVQRGFGHQDPETGTQVCRWPDENCARFDSYGDVTPQQGTDVSDEVDGTDWTVPPDLAGTLIGLGGHMHPGGIRDEVSLIRDGVEKPIFSSEALYWDYDDTSRVGAPPYSWNLSMTVTGLPLGWGVQIEPGDKLRINAVYDSEDSSWYENMGIVVALVAQDPHDGDEGLDVFDPGVTIDRGYSDLGLVPDGPWHYQGFTPDPCTPDMDMSDGSGTLCLRGTVTHGQIEESGNTFDGCTESTCPPLDAPEGPVVSDIVSAGFTYGNADLGVVGAAGIPRLVKGETARFWNYDSAARIWHTFTRCEEPCNGPTTVNYPIANGGNGSPDDEMDFDSAQIGYGFLFEPAKSQIGGGGETYGPSFVQDALYWEFTPTETGTFTFYCRIHPGMRGAFEVVEPSEADGGPALPIQASGLGSAL